MSGDNRVFPPLSTPQLTLSSAVGGNFSKNISTSLKANTTQTTPYSLTFPSTLPTTANQALLSDTSGTLTWGTVAASSPSNSNSATFGSFAATAPQATPATITGFQIINTFTSAQVYVSVSATTNIFSLYDLQVYQKGSSSTWSLTYSLTTDSDDIDPGLVFSISSTGQILYTSPSYPGWTATNIQWYYTYNYTTSTTTSQITNTFSGASNVTTPTAITGLTIPSGSFQMTVSLFVAVKAATNLSALISVNLYLNAAGTAYSISTQNTGDNVGVLLTVNAAGQVLYTSTTYASFNSLLFSWTTPFISSATATSLTSLSLSSGLVVNGGTLLGQSAASGSVVSTVGALLSVAGATFTDISTAASSTATGTFSGTYLGAPTLRATNTGVTNSVASTLTIGGAPVAGTNTTVTNAYALNVLSGISQFGGNILSNGTLTAKGISGLALTLGNAVLSGSISGSSGSFLNVQTQTYTDTGTAASSTASGFFSASYLGVPTLAASATAVTTATASTLTIAGAPIAGTNETITNAYALNVLSGNVNLNGIIIANGTSTPYWQWYNSSPTFVTVSGNGNLYSPTSASLIPSSYPGLATSGTLTGNSIFTIPADGNYRMDLNLQIAQGGSAGMIAIWFQLSQGTGPTLGGFSTNNRLGRMEAYYTGAQAVAHSTSANASGLKTGWTLQPVAFNTTAANISFSIADMRIARC